MLQFQPLQGQPVFNLETRMMDEWSLRDEILTTTHRWPVILVFCLVGGLLGWGVSLVRPSPYQATTELYVGLNVYRATQDQNVSAFADGFQFTNVDDYKNWQMANLNTFVRMNTTARRTLDQLRSQDPYWLNVTREELSTKLRVYWLNAGKWRMVAEYTDPDRASQVVASWRDVVLEEVNAAVSHAQNTMVLDIRIQSITSDQTRAVSRSIELAQIRDSLQAWRKTAAQWSSDQPIEGLESWRLWSWAAIAANFDPAWKAILDGYPTADAPLQDYIDWLNRADISIGEEIEILQTQIEALELERANLAEQYATASKKSLGFSANLIVEKISDAPPQVAIVRPTSLLALVGSVLGLLTWAMVWIVRITLRKGK